MTQDHADTYESDRDEAAHNYVLPLPNDYYGIYTIEQAFKAGADFANSRAEAKAEALIHALTIISEMDGTGDWDYVAKEVLEKYAKSDT